ncbi:hypothetical protein [Microbacterium sp. H83]|uniref:hypothetical protein n=1 Tax=Microbacterium sp. H83 TaxID=1827324 RepID=UPI0007F35821|nr:hypothetical protein [Microbacterium sp. H83]OAN33411.1 hypothetical protein A4X16_07070 [Microbacterium sp. H83]
MFAWVASRIVDDRAVAYGAVVVNSSVQAIYDVTVRVTGADGTERRPVALTILPPGAYHPEESAEAYGREFASRLRSFTNSPRRRSMKRCDASPSPAPIARRRCADAAGSQFSKNVASTRPAARELGCAST